MGFVAEKERLLRIMRRFGALGLAKEFFLVGIGTYSFNFSASRLSSDGSLSDPDSPSLPATPEFSNSSFPKSSLSADANVMGGDGSAGLGEGSSNSG